MAEVLLCAEAVSVERGGRLVLTGVDLEAHRGEVLAVLGPNGAGKSSLLRALAGLLPHRGRVLLCGDDAAGLDARERAKRLGFVPQSSALRSALAVRDVVAQGRYAHRPAFGGLRRDDRAAIERALALTDLTRFAARPFTALSFGEQRRVLLARGLASGAPVLCLDEPTAALDVGHALQLYLLLRRLAGEGHAVIVVLHQLDDALRHADRALLLADGVPVGLGKSAEVVAIDRVREVYQVEMRHGEGLGFHPCPEPP